jgi:hypothetical protein
VLARLLCLKVRSARHLRGNYIKRGDSYNSSKHYYDDKRETIHLDGIPECPTLEDEFDTLLGDAAVNGIDPVLKNYQEKQNSVNELIHWLHRKHNIESIEDLSFQEWRDVAFVMDRLFFVIFLFITILSTAAILSLRPEQELSGFMEIQLP